MFVLVLLAGLLVCEAFRILMSLVRFFILELRISIGSFCLGFAFFVVE